MQICRLVPMGLFGAFLKLGMLAQIQDWGSSPSVLCGRPLLRVGRFIGKSCLCCSGTVWNCCIAGELLVNLLKCGTEAVWKKGSDFRKAFFRYTILQSKLRLSASWWGDPEFSADLTDCVLADELRIFQKWDRWVSCTVPGRKKKNISVLTEPGIHPWQGWTSN